MKDFAAIDFETANEWPSSVCSVGIVVVRGGRITDSFYSLIHPEPEYYQWFCRRVHGISAADTEDAPVFPDVWERIAQMIEGLPLVAHNAPFDEGCLKAVFRVYQMDYPRTTSSIPSPPPAALNSPGIITPSPTPRHALISRSGCSDSGSPIDAPDHGIIA